MPTISLTETAIFVALKTVLTGFGFQTTDASGIFPIVKGQTNRVASPSQSDYLVMWPLMNNQLATNIDTDVDISFNGSIQNNILSVTTTPSGAIPLGQIIYGTGINPGVSITAQKTGTPGGIGTYSLSGNPDLASTTIFCGQHQMLQLIDAVIQCDIHGPSSGDNIRILSALIRDQVAVQAFDDLGLDIAPLYIDGPRQLPFTTAEDQWEDRWTVDLHLQINPVITVTQQFAAALAIETVEVESTFPP